MAAVMPIPEMRETLPEAFQDEFDDIIDQFESMESALTTVKYWLHDFFYLNKPAGDPHRILRIVEEALGD